MRFVLISVVVIILCYESYSEGFETVEAIVGEDVLLPCNVTSEVDDDKINVLAWYRNGSSKAIYSRDYREDTEATGVSDSVRYKLLEGDDEAALQIASTKPSDAGLYYCLADFATGPAHKTHVVLQLVEPPQRLWVVHENGSRVATATMGSNVSRDLGPFYVGDTVRLFCVAYGGRPQSTVKWVIDGQPAIESWTPLSERRVRSDVSFGPLAREDHGKVLSCLANNNNLTSALAVDVVLDILLPPLLVHVRSTTEEKGAVRMRAGEPLALQCRVLGARPPPTVLWKLNDGVLYNLEQNITLDDSQQLLVSGVEVSVSRGAGEAAVTCCADAHRRDGTLACAEPLPLLVLYPPELKISFEGEVTNNTAQVVKGSTVSMNCSWDANPPVFELVWYHGDRLITQEVEETGFLIDPLLELKDVDDDNTGEYVCAASNEVASTTSEPLRIVVVYSPYCKEPEPLLYGVGDNAFVNLTCNMIGSPAPIHYTWLLVDREVNEKVDPQEGIKFKTKENTLNHQRINGTAITTIFCWGENGVTMNDSPNEACVFVVTDETAPQPPAQCSAVRILNDISITCRKGHDGGSNQKFIFKVVSLQKEEQLISMIKTEPIFFIEEPTEDYKIIIVSRNDKGDSDVVEILKDDIEERNQESVEGSLPNITILSLSLCGGVAVLALAACGLVLCAGERAEQRPEPLRAYHMDDSNCETFNDSEDGSVYNLKRTESFRRAIAGYPSKSDLKRTSSFHSTRGILEATDEIRPRPYSTHCRVHSMQNISRKRDTDSMCDHLIMRLPQEHGYGVPKPMNTFYTMPRKVRSRAREMGDETSVITQNSDGLSLPPPPDEFNTYRPASRFNTTPKPNTTYATISKDFTRNTYRPQLSKMNAIGIPTISGSDMYSHTNDDHKMDNNPFDTSE